MVTLFSIPKPFRGHIGTIQRNAIRSWTLLRSTPEILLLGDDLGTSEVAREIGAKHISHIARNEFGTPLLSDVFSNAEQSATNDVLCFVNSDIILANDLLDAVDRINLRPFLMIGQRWDLDMEGAYDFTNPDWNRRLRQEVNARGALHPHTGVDYYVFSKGLWGTLPPFAIGRTTYDNWLIWKARSLGVPVIDATRVVMSVHQNHERTYTSMGVEPPDESDNLIRGTEARQNLELAGGKLHRFTLHNANWMLTSNRMLPAIAPKYLLGRAIPHLRKLLLKVANVHPLLRRASARSS